MDLRRTGCQITVYRQGDAGELFDFAADPGETRNLWDEPTAVPLKTRMLHAFLQAMAAEPTPAPRRAGA